MARPVKNCVDYFPHDADMRNHKKVKALRLKFGVTGYAIWSMILEYLSGSDGNVFAYTEMEFELMAGDFGVSATEIRDTVNYCISLEMLFNRDGFIHSESLDERLAPVYQKRGKAKELSKKQLRSHGQYVCSNTGSLGVSVTEMPQSKVKEIKGNKTKGKRVPIGGEVKIPFIEGTPVSKAWEEWEQFRKEKKSPLTPTTVKKQMQFLGGRADPEIIAILNQSMTQGWTGLFEIKDHTNGNQNNRRHTTGTIRRADAVFEAPKDFGNF